MKLLDVVIEMKSLQDQINELKGKLSLLRNKYDAIRKEVMPGYMAEEGLDKFTAIDIGTIYLRDDLYVSIPAAARADAYEWLEENGYGELIITTINPSVLKAWVKEQMAANAILPEELFKVTPYQFAVINKR